MTQFGARNIPLIPQGAGSARPDMAGANLIGSIQNAIASAMGIATTAVQAQTTNEQRKQQAARDQARLEIAGLRNQVADRQREVTDIELQTAEARLETHRLQDEAYRTKLETDALKEKWDRMAEAERYGMLDIVGSMDPNSAAKVFEQFPMMDPRNRTEAARLIGNQAAASALAEIQTTVGQHAIDNDGDMAGLSVVDLVGQAMARFDNFDPEARVAAQSQLISQTEGMLRAFSNATIHRRQAEMAKIADSDAAREAARFIAGELTSEDLMSSTGSVLKLDPKVAGHSHRLNARVAEHIASNVIDRLRLPTTSADFDVIEKQMSSLPAGIRGRLNDGPFDIDGRIAKARTSYYAAQAEKAMSAISGIKTHADLIAAGRAVREMDIPNNTAGMKYLEAVSAAFTDARATFTQKQGAISSAVDYINKTADERSTIQRPDVSHEEADEVFESLRINQEGRLRPFGDTLATMLQAGYTLPPIAKRTFESITSPLSGGNLQDAIGIIKAIDATRGSDVALDFVLNAGGGDD